MPAFVSATFPLELERYIFEICGRSRPIVIPKLMLIAWRVREWVEPLLYHTIAVQYTAAIDGYPIFTWPVLRSAIRTKPASFFRDSVRNIRILFKAGLEADIATLLSVCTGVQNLSIAYVHPLEPSLDEMSLITSLRLTHFYGNLNKAVSRPSPTHSSFAHITHLGMKYGMLTPTDDVMLQTCSHLSLMPRLTHLSLDGYRYMKKCLHILETCKFLRVVIALRGDVPLDHVTALSRDLRFVKMRNKNLFRDWQMGTHTGVDYWARAEDFIAKRRSGEINSLEYVIPEDASLHIA
ncbi:hypothetical protein B0H19DRAFT_1381027 [Mycena capillaripes]|nr:hypothetical protein B0H19DRAFT_1381027 [Mycena capillaripes]